VEGVLVWVGVGLGVLTLLTLSVALFQVVKQQGRLLLRLDNIEQRLAQVGQEARAAATNGGQARAGSAVQPGGIAVGTALSPFRLPRTHSARPRAFGVGAPALPPACCCMHATEQHSVIRAREGSRREWGWVTDAVQHYRLDR
jgi:hypothetical protein